nr:hypothetical transcript [Hymenolepis microstoma]
MCLIPEYSLWQCASNHCDLYLTDCVWFISSPYMDNLIVTSWRLSAASGESQDTGMSSRPPIHPKPKVAPRGTADPRIITPDYYADRPASDIDPKFTSLKFIQSGYTKKRVDLFEAL